MGLLFPAALSPFTFTSACLVTLLPLSSLPLLSLFYLSSLYPWHLQVFASTKKSKLNEQCFWFFALTCKLGPTGAGSAAGIMMGVEAESHRGTWQTDNRGKESRACLIQTVKLAKKAPKIKENKIYSLLFVLTYNRLQKYTWWIPHSRFQAANEIPKNLQAFPLTTNLCLHHDAMAPD